MTVKTDIVTLKSFEMNDEAKSIVVNFIHFYLYQRRGIEYRLKDVLLHKIILAEKYY